MGISAYFNLETSVINLKEITVDSIYYLGLELETDFLDTTYWLGWVEFW